MGPPASFDVSPTISYASRSRVLVMGPLLMICLPDIIPRIYFSQKPMSLISLAAPTIILADLDVLDLPVVLPLDVGQ